MVMESGDAFRGALARVRDRLLAERSADGHWVGRLSSSALATATAAAAAAVAGGESERDLLGRTLAWIAAHQNADGGWGDTVRSRSNLSTTALCWAALAFDPEPQTRTETVRRAERFISDRAGGPNGVASGDLDPERVARAVIASYGKDRTFSAPILSMCALAGRLGEGRDAWREVPALPFELAACPERWLKWLRLPVVSYALPALVAIGQAKHHFDPPACPVARFARNFVRKRTLAVLERIQPASGGFLEAVPLTSFVAMSLAAIGRGDHPVVRKALGFLKASVREDGSLPIDTNLATWVTTLAVNALAESPEFDMLLGPAERARLRDWILGGRHLEVHPYTGAEPGGWAWTDLPGGVPDADDTAGALLALRHLVAADPPAPGQGLAVCEAAAAGVRWLLRLQNSDGGVPTFCHGWGALEFDKSAPDLTAHALRAWVAWLPDLPEDLATGVRRAVPRAAAYIERTQRPDGSWLPLWFGNELAEGETNPTYGTARVLLALEALGREQRLDAGLATRAMMARGAEWLLGAQGPDGGWGGAGGVAASIEETALALEALAGLILVPRTGENRTDLPVARARAAARRGVAWLIKETDAGRRMEPAPIGFYFAKLWYFERLYPLVFTVAALEKAAAAGLFAP